MTEFDDRLRQHLSADDEVFLKNLEGERGLLTQSAALFDGPLKYISMIAMVIVLIVSGVGIWAVLGFVNAESVRGMLLWGGGAWAAWTVQIGIKDWLHSRMNYLMLLREVKRLELRLAALVDERG